MGVDLGERRIGVALSDRSGVLASPFTVLERCGDTAAESARLAQIAADEGVETVVVGMPLSLSGKAGPAARRAEAETETLIRALDLPVVTVDERFSTVEAVRRRQERGRRGKSQSPVDAEAAAVLLQAWLDRQRRSALGDDR